MSRTRDEAVKVAELFGAPKGAKVSEQGRALLKGLIMAGGSKRQVAKVLREIEALERQGK